MQSDQSEDAKNDKGVNTPYDVLAGTIIGAHGVQGAVKIKLATGTAISLIQPSQNAAKSTVPVWISRTPSSGEAEPDDSLVQAGTVYKIKQVKEIQPGGRVLLLKLAGITDRNVAEALVGLNVYSPKERRAKLDEGEYFTEDLIGLDVVSDTGRNFGKVTAVLQQPANDVYETDKGALIPAVKSVVKSVDIENKKITVENLLGLFQTEADELLGDASDHLPDPTVEAENSKWLCE